MRCAGTWSNRLSPALGGPGASATGKAALKGTWDELTGRLLSLGWSAVGPGGFTGAVTFAEAPVGEAVGAQLDLEALANSQLGGDPIRHGLLLTPMATELTVADAAKECS